MKQNMILKIYLKYLERKSLKIDDKFTRKDFLKIFENGNKYLTNENNMRNIMYND
jgi:hypothetical protein